MSEPVQQLLHTLVSGLATFFWGPVAGAALAVYREQGQHKTPSRLLRWRLDWLGHGAGIVVGWGVRCMLR